MPLITDAKTVTCQRPPTNGISFEIRTLFVPAMLLAGLWSGYLLSAVLLTCACVLFLHYLNAKYTYWSQLGVNSPPATLLLGHILHRMGIKKPFMEFFDDLYYNYNGRDFCGYYDFLHPGLFVGNPEILKSILVKDFEYFADRRTFDLGKVNPIANDMLTNARGQHWRFIRSIVSPTFTPGKTRRLFPLMTNRANQLLKQAKEEAKKGPVEARALCGRYTMDSIASCAFGIECDAYSSDAVTFPIMASKVMQLSPVRALKILVLLVAPKIAEVVQKLGIDFTSPEFHFFRQVVTQTLRMREKGGLRRGDFLDLLMESRMNGKEGLSDNTITAQAILFLLAGYDNTANTLAMTLHLLAQHPHTQAKLRRELANEMIKCSGQIPHDRLMELPYMDAVISESLRLYPAAPVIERICTKPYTIGGTTIHLKKGQPVLVPIWSIHRDPQHWPQPTEFIPERFLGDSKNSIAPYTYLPFGHGPRSCIGLKFATLSVKIGLMHLLTSMKLLPSEKSIYPVQLDPRVLTLQPKDGVYIDFIECNLEDMLKDEVTSYSLTSIEDKNLSQGLAEQYAYCKGPEELHSKSTNGLNGLDFRLHEERNKSNNVVLTVKTSSKDRNSEDTQLIDHDVNLCHTSR